MVKILERSLVKKIRDRGLFIWTNPINGFTFKAGFRPCETGNAARFAWVLEKMKRPSEAITKKDTDKTGVELCST